MLGLITILAMIVVIGLFINPASSLLFIVGLMTYALYLFQ